jgi:phosphatidylinositol N-acetylglucosaminyltransferase subunit P
VQTRHRRTQSLSNSAEPAKNVRSVHLWELRCMKCGLLTFAYSFKGNAVEELPTLKLEKARRKYPRSNGSASSTSRRVQSDRGFRTSSGETQSDHKFNDISGFVGFILTVLLYVVYLIWAFVPDSYLHRIGVTWLPSKFWTLAIPTWMYISYIFFMLFPNLLVMFDEMAIDTRAGFEDEFTSLTQHIRNPYGGDVPLLVDIPIEDVNRIMYQSGICSAIEQQAQVLSFRRTQSSPLLQVKLPTDAEGSVPLG